MSSPLTEADWAALRRTTADTIETIAGQVGLPNVLLPYQSKAVGLLEATAIRVLFIEKSRRIGMTWGLASYAVLRAAREKTAGGMDAMYISYSQEMTREFIDACAMWARAYAVAALSEDEFLFEDTDPADPTETRHIQAFRIRFASGFEILALSSAPRSLRGKQGVVIIDEAAFVDQLAELLKAALAFLMWGGQVVVCSTHDGSENDFNIAVQDILAGRSKYAHLRVDLDDALKDGLFERICLVQGTDWSAEGEAAFRQDIIDFYGEGADEELFCIPAMGSGTWLAAPLIEARMMAEAPVLRLDLPRDFLHRDRLAQRVLVAPFREELDAVLADLDQSPLYAFGFDFGRVSDLTVGCLLAMDRTLTRREVLSFELRGVPGEEQKDIVKAVLTAVQTRLVGATFDATGMGWTVAEDMGRRFGLREDPDGAGLVMAIHFSETWYRLEMPPLKAAFEDETLYLGKDADHLSDLRAVKLIRGIPRVPPIREGEKGRKRHGDYAIALALAHFASRMQWREFGYEPVAQNPSRFEERGPEETLDGAFRLAGSRRKGLW
ncbi:hypothetical protein J7481_06640 [Labrenzia sp. R4_2]|uniref:terminase large subunit domain-containing protein n=1 Tax=Labrenzia sp. R4_2 TaxID=2821107 RepID=UPI001ADC49D3|nr:terminase family protein [Labrenzia sp. R4_2]MBO9419166.1 hypothetical protein [Labrenzia sp. R4_2]